MSAIAAGIGAGCAQIDSHSLEEPDPMKLTEVQEGGYSLEQFNASVAPFKADVLWSKILILISQPNGNIDINVAEKVFGIEINNNELSDNSGFYFGYVRQSYWYTDIMIGKINETSKYYFLMKWHFDAFLPDNDVTCLSRSKVRNDLLVNKWEEKGTVLYAGRHSDTYSKGKYEVEIFLAGENCVSGIKYGAFRK